jgi:MFS transporter, YNFM family, putative membrane transport protein
MTGRSVRGEPLPQGERSQKTRTAAVVLAGFCSFLVLYAPQPLLPMLAAEFRKSAAAIGLLITATSMAVAIAAPFAGVLSDRFGRKRVIVPAAALLAVPALLAATSSGYGQLLFWRFWQGVFTPGVFAVTIAYINDEWTHGAGAAIAAYVSGTVLGGFAGRLIAALIAAQFSWRWAFIALGILNVACAAGIGLLLPADRHFAPHRGRRASSARAMLRHLKNPRLVATYAVGFCVLFTLIGTFTYATFYLAGPPFGLSTRALGFLFVVYLVGAIITPIFGRWIDRLGHRYALAIGVAGGMVGIGLTLSHHLSSVVAGLALCCTGVFIAQSSASSHIGVVTHEARAAAVGLYVMSYYTGGSFGAAVPGHLWTSGGWAACAALIAGVQALTIAVALLFWRPDVPAPQIASSSSSSSCL